MGELVASSRSLQRDNLHIRIDGVQRGARGLDLRRADRIAAVEDLALQVGEIDLVGIGEREPADAAAAR